MSKFLEFGGMIINLDKINYVKRVKGRGIKFSMEDDYLSFEYKNEKIRDLVFDSLWDNINNKGILITL